MLLLQLFTADGPNGLQFGTDWAYAQFGSVKTGAKSTLTRLGIPASKIKQNLPSLCHIAVQRGKVSFALK